MESFYFTGFVIFIEVKTVARVEQVLVVVNHYLRSRLLEMVLLHIYLKNFRENCELVFMCRITLVIRQMILIPQMFYTQFSLRRLY